MAPALSAASRRQCITLVLPVLDFLAPRWVQPIYHHRPRYTSSSSALPSSSNNSTSPAPAQAATPASQSQPEGQLSASQAAYLSRALRINQAGELAATLIYASQTPVLTRSHPSLGPLLKHMYTQEAGHLSTFNTLLARHRIRPTALTPVWRAAASFLGWSTGRMGREAAMACTEAVETEIGGHYNDQVRVLLAWKREMEERGEVFPRELAALLEDVRRIRDEELEHLDTAVEHDARLATAWPVLTAVIRGGCRGAIWVTGRM